MEERAKRFGTSNEGVESSTPAMSGAEAAPAE